MITRPLRMISARVGFFALIVGSAGTGGKSRGAHRA